MTTKSRKRSRIAAAPIEPVATERIVYVDRDKFCDLLISRRRLYRADDNIAKLRGLVDVDRGIRYLIEESKLN